jgi:hypothetical protein
VEVVGSGVREQVLEVFGSSVTSNEEEREKGFPQTKTEEGLGQDLSMSWLDQDLSMSCSVSLSFL